MHVAACPWSVSLQLWRSFDDFTVGANVLVVRLIENGGTAVCNALYMFSSAVYCTSIHATWYVCRPSIAHCTTALSNIVLNAKTVLGNVVDLLCVKDPDSSSPTKKR